MESRGLRGLLVDLDNTLAPYRSTFADDAVKTWIESMRDYTLIIFSNASEKRVSGFCEPLGLPYVARAGKPAPDKAVVVCEQFGLPAQNAALVGDQIFTDVLCANRAGLLSVIVEPFKRGPLVNLRRNVMEGRFIRKALKK
jgi:HAD superfamily phosphatase (TIGR01668 family)